MKIKHLIKDTNWQNRVEKIGYGYHSENGIPYWIDAYYFSISPEFADTIYDATTELWQMCLTAVSHVIENKKYALFHIPNYIQHHIERSWNEETPTRYNALDDFKNGTIDILIATDLIARGIHIENLPIVINYELPRSPLDYVHRIGRTGRANEIGKAISLISPEEEHHFKIIQKKAKIKIALQQTEDINLQGF